MYSHVNFISILSSIDIAVSVNCFNFQVFPQEKLADDNGDVELEVVNNAVQNMSKILKRTLLNNDPAKTSQDLASFSTIIQEMVNLT